MKARFAAGEAAAYLAAVAILAALVHLIVVLIVPLVASRDAFQRLEPLGGLNETVVLPRAGPTATLLPYADPAVAMSFCRYDLTQGPIRVTAPSGRAFASISFHTKRGLVFYALTDRAATHGVIDAVLATPERREGARRPMTMRRPVARSADCGARPQGYVAMRVFSELPKSLPGGGGRGQAAHVHGRTRPAIAAAVDIGRGWRETVRGWERVSPGRTSR